LAIDNKKNNWSRIVNRQLAIGSRETANVKREKYGRQMLHMSSPLLRNEPNREVCDASKDAMKYYSRPQNYISLYSIITLSNQQIITLRFSSSS
jgi:hypothetical protein